MRHSHPSLPRPARKTPIAVYVPGEAPVNDLAQMFANAQKAKYAEALAVQEQIENDRMAARNMFRASELTPVERQILVQNQRRARATADIESCRKQRYGVLLAD